MQKCSGEHLLRGELPRGHPSPTCRQAGQAASASNSKATSTQPPPSPPEPSVLPPAQKEEWDQEARAHVTSCHGLLASPRSRAHTHVCWERDLLSAKLQHSRIRSFGGDSSDDDVLSWAASSDFSGCGVKFVLPLLFFFLGHKTGVCSCRRAERDFGTRRDRLHVPLNKHQAAACSGGRRRRQLR